MTAVEHAALLSAMPLNVRIPGRGRTISAGEIRLLEAVSELGDSERSIADVLADDAAIDLAPELALAVVVSLGAANPLFRRLELDHGLVVAAALRHSGTLSAPVSAGMTLYVDSTITAARPSSSRPEHLVVCVRDDARDAAGLSIMTVERVLLMRHDQPHHDASETNS